MYTWSPNKYRAVKQNSSRDGHYCVTSDQWKQTGTKLDKHQTWRLNSAENGRHSKIGCAAIKQYSSSATMSFKWIKKNQQDFFSHYNLYWKYDFIANEITRCTDIPCVHRGERNVIERTIRRVGCESQPHHHRSNNVSSKIHSLSYLYRCTHFVYSF